MEFLVVDIHRGNARWIDVSVDVEDMDRDMKQFGYEVDEFEIQDRKGCEEIPHDATFEDIAIWAELCEEYGRDAVRAVIGCVGWRTEYAQDSLIEGRYMGEHESLTEWGESVMEEKVEKVMGDLAIYFDYAKWASNQIDNGVREIKFDGMSHIVDFSYASRG